MRVHAVVSGGSNFESKLIKELQGNQTIMDIFEPTS